MNRKMILWLALLAAVGVAVWWPILPAGARLSPVSPPCTPLPWRPTPAVEPTPTAVWRPTPGPEPWPEATVVAPVVLDAPMSRLFPAVTPAPVRVLRWVWRAE